MNTWQTGKGAAWTLIDLDAVRGVRVAPDTDGPFTVYALIDGRWVSVVETWSSTDAADKLGELRSAWEYAANRGRVSA